MNFLRSMLALTAGIILGLPTAMNAQSSNPDDQYWDDRFGSSNNGAGVDQDVFALAVGNGELYAGGSFLKALQLEVDHVARFDGRNWATIGNDTVGIGVNGPVFALAVEGDKVYIAGDFTMAGKLPVSNIAVWNIATRQWSTLGEGISGGEHPYIASISVVNDSVFVGGQFTTAGTSSANNVALWNGNQWSGLGSGIDGTVNAVLFSEKVFYAGGNFTTAGGVTVNGVARWNGAQWKDLLGGVSGGYVNAIYPATDWGGGVIIGGKFEGPSQNLAWFRGNNWIQLFGGGDGPPSVVGGEVRAIAMNEGRLFIGGTFTTTFPEDLNGSGSSPISTPYIARYEGLRIGNYAWHGLRQGTNGYVNALVADGWDLYVGGEFTQVSGLAANHVARWDQVNWYPLGAIIGNTIRSITLNDNGIYVAWNSVLPGSGTSRGHLMKWEEEGWKEIDGETEGEILSLTSYGNKVYLGGAFMTAGEEIAVNVASWETGSGIWEPLTEGSGVAGGPISFVAAVAVGDQSIYVGGQFTIADTLPAWNIAQWDIATKAWSAVGKGINGAVRAMALADNGDLYVAGDFSIAGADSASRIARWDGTAWRPLGGGANKSVTAIAINGNDLYIGGDFDTVDGSRMNHIAHWNIAEEKWSPLGDGLSQGFMPQVAALAIYGRNVYAAGYFYTAGSDSVYNIARWDGSRWTALGSGLNGNAFALASNGAEVYVGGAFTQAGDKQSLFFGLWHTPPSGTDAGSASTHSLVSMTNYPNPSTERTIIHLMTTKSAPAEIAVYDVEGRRVALLHEGTLEAGEHDLTWESESAPPGMYVCRARVGETIESTRVIVTR